MSCGALRPWGWRVQSIEVVHTLRYLEGLCFIQREKFRMRFVVGGAITSSADEARYADPLGHVLGDMPSVEVRTALIRNSIPDRDRSLTGQHLLRSLFVLNCYDMHRHGLKAFKARFDALSDFCVMNTGEGAGHDDLTRLQESLRRARWLAGSTTACSGSPIGF